MCVCVCGEGRVCVFMCVRRWCFVCVGGEGVCVCVFVCVGGEGVCVFVCREEGDFGLVSGEEMKRCGYNSVNFI